MMMLCLPSMFAGSSREVTFWAPMQTELGDLSRPIFIGHVMGFVYANLPFCWNKSSPWKEREGMRPHVSNSRCAKAFNDQRLVFTNKKQESLHAIKQRRCQSTAEGNRKENMTIDASMDMPRDIPLNADMLPQTRTAVITVYGASGDRESKSLSSQLQELEGVREALVSPFLEGGLRGGILTAQLEIENRISLKQAIQSIQDLYKEAIVLPFALNLWTWRGHRINYGVAGTGKAVLLVHGFGGNAGHFGNLVAYLADHYKVYAIDLLGFGASDKPPNVDYGPDLWAEQICDFAKEVVNEGAVLIGNSIGSLTSLVAAARSSFFRGLVLLNCAGAMNRKGLMQDDLILQALTPIFQLVEYLLQKPRIARFLFNRFRSKGNIRKILEEQAYRDKGAVTDQLVDILYQPSIDEGALDVFVKVFTGNPGPRPETLMPQIESPVLVLWGENDPWTPINGPVAKYFTTLSSERANVQIYGLADVGHCPHDDRPELAVQHILVFLANVDW